MFKECEQVARRDGRPKEVQGVKNKDGGKGLPLPFSMLCVINSLPSLGLLAYLCRVGQVALSGLLGVLGCDGFPSVWLRGIQTTCPP